MPFKYHCKEIVNRLCWNCQRVMLVVVWSVFLLLLPASPTWAQNKTAKASPKKTTPARKIPAKKTPAKKQQPKIGANYNKVAYDIYVRAGLVAYVKQDLPKAVELFEKAKPFQPPRTFTVVHGTVPTGIDRLITAAKQGKSLTPKSVLEGDE
ncbi:hypothetical protein MNBD_PLANCTO02-1280, partial [hydrothermal vent metagenome]